jgi:hypothetical protein
MCTANNNRSMICLWMAHQREHQHRRGALTGSRRTARGSRPVSASALGVQRCTCSIRTGANKGTGNAPAHEPDGLVVVVVVGVVVVGAVVDVDVPDAVVLLP